LEHLAHLLRRDDGKPVVWQLLFHVAAQIGDDFVRVQAVAGRQ
jgi:hypothetical protein